MLILLVLIVSSFLGGASATVMDNEVKKGISSGIVMK